MSGSTKSPVIVVCANQAWNLVNFRADLIAALIEAGCRVIAAAPPDPAMQARLEANNLRYAPGEGRPDGTNIFIHPQALYGMLMGVSTK